MKCSLRAVIIAHLLYISPSAFADGYWSKDKKFHTVVAAMSAVRNQLRDPDSVVWEYAGIDGKGTVLCLKYRAKNGFGGVGREITIITNTRIMSDAEAWNRLCTSNDIEDFTYAKHAL